MRLALAQINPIVGDLAGNLALHARALRRARDAGADLVVFPELSLTGYPPRDLLLHPGFRRDAWAAAQTLGREHTAGLTAVFGVPRPMIDASRPPHAGEAARAPDADDLNADDLDAAWAALPSASDAALAAAPLANALLVYAHQRPRAYYDKRLLPIYDVFDEDRYFVPGAEPVVIDVAGWRVGLSICEDLWRGEDVGFADRYRLCPDPVLELVNPPPRPSPRRAGPAQIIINPSASPFVLGKGARHRALLARQARTHRVHVAAVNQVGGNDELIFDGHACLFGPAGELIAAAPGFEEHLLIVDLPAAPGPGASGAAPAPAGARPAVVPPAVPTVPTVPADPVLTRADEDHLFRALTLGVRDYVRKTGFDRAVLGLSGGIDSALVGVIAAAALGPSRVLGLSMPGPYSSRGSRDDAAALARALGVRLETIPIDPAFDALGHSLAPLFHPRPPDVTEENLQSRLRGTILMAASNKLGGIVLTTGNKSEMAVGYCTLYGDMNGGLAVLSDVTKHWVYRLARWINARFADLPFEPALREAPIPEASITKPPSAELRPNQTDQDSLPPYDVLDAIIELAVEHRLPAARVRDALARRGLTCDDATLRRVLRLIDVSEYKRRQAAPGLKVTGVAFGSGRRMPIAQGYRPERSLD